MHQNILEIKNFTCGYQNKFVIEGIDFQLKKASFAGIVGPNGSGKTTLFKGITAELPGLKGNILLDGQNIHKMNFKQRACKLAIVAQNIESPDITVEDYVIMGRMPYHKKYQFFESPHDFELAQKYMKLTGVIHLKDKYMNELSGGEQQLAAIARALCQEPELLLLDEPTSHLDIGHQVQILNLIQNLNQEMGLSVLMIIHDLNLAGEYCNFLIMLDNGKMHTAGTPEEVLDYKNIEEVYKTVVITQKNPVSGKPAVFLVSGSVLRSQKA
ncbi:MAG: ABC transporter ATP-binding protein [Bacteroidales bacterium]|nr:ABC transporter ATP-binding protein [Bacteroidales bacterium]